MKAHASGGSASASNPHQPPEPLPPESHTKPSPAMTGGGGGRRVTTSERQPLAPAAAAAAAAVKKGFLDSGGGAGRLYGEEGSREGGGPAAVGICSRGGDRSSNPVDREFERLMALADPDMDGTTGGCKASRSKWRARVRSRVCAYLLVLAAFTYSYLCVRGRNREACDHTRCLLNAYRSLGAHLYAPGCTGIRRWCSR